MYTSSFPTFSLDNFEGPLELLIYLIQKEEIDICAIPIKKLTAQFMHTLEGTPEVETSSETLTLAATLLLLKSQKLLPQDKWIETLDEDPRIEIIQSLIEYCRLKDAAKALSLKEEVQKAHFPRATLFFRKELGSGLEEIEIDNLKNLLNEMLKRSAQQPSQVIQGEEWQISDKLDWLRGSLGRQNKLLLSELCAETKSRSELIVLFLALLELMKHQEAAVVKQNETLYITIYESRT